MIRIIRISNSDYSFAKSDKVGLSQVAEQGHPMGALFLFGIVKSFHYIKVSN